ncbi:MAG: hypothetical protein NT061_10965 [Spirochaetes bacterium]|nr:hypothetical protein [Spirochaetota bacterium]
MAKSRLLQIYKKLVSSLSFSAELRKMRREVNARIDAPTTINTLLPSHPSGVNRWFKRRRISIAESYLTVVGDLDSRSAGARLEALKILADASFHSKSLDLPLNTARVQAALVKEVVKHRHDKRRQLELLYDFSVSSSGQHQVIRKLCEELNIVELPENGTRLSDFGFGWDEHVHDTATSGRKNPTQLIIDAFIKGISRLTVAYGSATDLEAMEEVFEAGRIIGIGVDIALEFSMTDGGERFHFMALLPRFRKREEIAGFFLRKSPEFREFLTGLEKNQLNRLNAVGRILDEFNATTLRALNEGWPEDTLYRVPELTMQSLYAFIPTASINRLHLAEFLYTLYMPVLLNRLQILKVKKGLAKRGQRAGRLSKTEYLAIDEAYGRLKAEFRSLTPEVLLERHFAGARIVNYQSAFEDIREASGVLRSAGCKLKILHPLEYGFERARRLLAVHRADLDFVEIYNTQDCIGRDPKEVLKLAALVNDINREQKVQGLPPLVPVCGSDSTGRNPKIPGMGFIFADKIWGKKKSAYLERHLALPGLVSAMVKAGGEAVGRAEVDSCPPIICLGKISGGSGFGLGEDVSSDSAIVPFSKALRYLNPWVKNVFYAVVGFVVANHFVGPFYAILWLGITGFRNSIADLISSRGARLNQWKLRSINFDNVAQSLFWTGFSVPIMGFIKTNFDILWPWVHDGILFNLVKFFFISLANGLYLATHNTLRGFDKQVVKANLFRSIIAWPFATVFAPLGNLMGIPSIVQTKIWSDFVAGFIEGSGKYVKVLRLRHRNLEEIVPKVIEEKGEAQYTSILDLLYLFREEPRTRTSLSVIFDPDRKRMFKPGEEGALPPRSLDELRSTLGAEGLGADLARHILLYYEQEIAVDLVDLVADTLPEIQDWLDGEAARRLRPSRS